MSFLRYVPASNIPEVFTTTWFCWVSAKEELLREATAKAANPSTSLPHTHPPTLYCV